MNIIWGICCILFLPESPTNVFGTQYGTNKEIIQQHDEYELIHPTGSGEETPLLNSSTLSAPPSYTSYVKALTATKPPTNNPISETASSERNGISIMDALLIPNVLGYALAFGFFKLVNYAM